MRKFWIEFHKISGLMILIPLLLQSISGSIIVFDHAIDEWLNPDILLTQPSDNAEQAPIGEVMASARSALPNTAYIKSLRKPRHDNTVYMAYVVMTEQSPYFDKRMEVLIDPYTAEVTAVREWGKYFASFVYLLHFTLLLDTYGALFLGFLAMLMFVNVIIGVYLGWPKSKAAWDWLLARKHRQTPLIGRLKRWHIMTGLISLPIFVVLILTGISMIFHDQTEVLFDRPHPPELNVHFDTEQSIDIDQWLPAAKAHWPEAKWLRIAQPTSNSPAVIVTMRQAGDPRKTTGSSQLWLHPQTNEVIAEQDYNALTIRQKTALWLFPLHSGEAFNLPGRLLIFLCGLLTSILTLAGGWLWYKRKFRPKRRLT
ncbi:PepSY-associated TM helix domain-containing protein [Methylophaga sp.]|uniref:PepSY-associated TM helix domain-containing protein n=1 Tax=Methylophaga sp. TaxID=2024840 RepID=UPI003F69F912